MDTSVKDSTGNPSNELNSENTNKTHNDNISPSKLDFKSIDFDPNFALKASHFF